IWIVPKTRGGKPYWGAAKFPKTERAGRFVTLASGFDDDQAAGALPIRADARVLGATVKAGERTDYPLAAGRNAYLVVAKGEATVNGVRLGERDGAAVRGEPALSIEATADAELVLVDAP
ncbi:MAG: hypothetical protein NW200_09815, partial [Hyphomonadaceae bacterium]|nr:hypothetical protein [Hyphomonadaceae bacterium]